MKAGELFEAGQSRAQVAEECGVTWRPAHEWRRVWSKGGADALKATTKPGPVLKFSEEDVAVIGKELRRGPVAHGYENDLWTLPRVGRLVAESLAKKASSSEVWRLLRRMRWSPQKPKRRARERNEEKIAQWKENKWPQLLAKAQAEKRTIVFVDEPSGARQPAAGSPQGSAGGRWQRGLTQKPAAKSTRVPEGQTPVLELNFNWKKLSVIGGITLKSLYFQLHEDSVKAPEVVAFLKHLG